MFDRDHGQYKFFIADDMLHFYDQETERSGFTEIHQKNMEHMFNKRKLFVELFEAWGHTHNLDGHKILEAHGDFENRQWNYYEDGKKLGRVQDWVDKNDGSAVALMVSSCNPKGSVLSSEHSLVLHTSELADSLPEMMFRQGLIRVFVPGKGYMERDYKGLRKLISELMPC